MKVTDFNDMTIKELEILNNNMGYGFIVEHGKIRGVEFENILTNLKKGKVK